MATLVGLEVRLAEMLNSLIELDYDAIEAYQAAIARISNVQDRDALTAFLQDHQRHVRELTVHVRRLNAEPKTGADIKRVLTRGKVVLAGLIGDQSILFAMRSNEKDTNTAYGRSLQRSDVIGELRETLRLGLLDERRHAAWLERRLHLDTRAAHL